MIKPGIILCIGTIAVVATDIVVRLLMAPRRRDQFIEDLLEHMAKLEPEPMEDAQPTPMEQDDFDPAFQKRSTRAADPVLASP